MEATTKQFNDFIINEITKNLGITIDQYKKIIFDAGITANKNNSKYKSHYTKTGVFWDCFSHHVNFINLKIIVEDKFYQSLNKGVRSVNNVEDYFEWITEKLELPKRSIFLINKQYKLDLHKISIVEKSNLTHLKQYRRTRTPRKVNNQLEINLNTI